MSHLPGGIAGSAGLARDYAFVPATGTLELALSEAVADEASVPDQVSAALAAALETVGGEPASRERVAGLAVGDRQYLMRRLALRLGTDEMWLWADCAGCGARFDFPLRLSALPVKSAGPGYPRTQVRTSQGHLCLRVPTGADQSALAGVADSRDALRALLRRCIVEGAHAGVEVDALSPEDIAAIDTALEAVAPEVSTNAEAPCPECARVNRVKLDPYTCLSRSGTQDIYEQVHTLAGYYHWSEAAILALPQGRRRRYLTLIERRSGYGGAGGPGFGNRIPAELDGVNAIPGPVRAGTKRRA